MLGRVPWHSNITTVANNRLVTHGVDQTEIIRSFTYEEMIFFLLNGRRPTSIQKEIFRAVLVAYVSHGITGQSTLAVMEAADCRSDFLSAMMAGFLVGSGKYHQGALHGTMMEIRSFAAVPENILEATVISRLRNRERIIGFGHRYHEHDPRARELVQLAHKLDFGDKYLNTALRIEKVLLEQKGLAMNLGAAAGGILLDLGFDPQIAPLIVVVGRGPMYAAAYLERLAQGKDRFQKIEVCDIVDVTEQEEG